MAKRELTLAAGLAPIAALGFSAGEAFAQPDSDYDAIGVSAGGFRFFPELSLLAENNDNVLATDVEANIQSDYLYQLLPSARLESDWNTHALNLSFEGASRFYSEFSDQNSTDVKGAMNARIDVDRSFNFTVEGNLASLSEPLSSSPSNEQLAEPVKFQQGVAAIGVAKSFNQLQVSAKAGLTDLDYDDGVILNDPDPLEQDDRDRSIVTYGVRADYTISPATSLFISGAANTREYDHLPTDPNPITNVNRNSEGVEVLGGVRFEATNLIQGEIGVGYLSQTYEQAGVPDVDGLAVRTAITWSPDELVDVHVGAERAVRDAGSIGAVGYVANDFSFGVDYAFRRNIDVGVQARYSRDEYNDIDREDKRWSFEGSIDYALNRGAAVFLSAGHDQQESTGALNQTGREFEINRVSIGLRLRR